MPSELLTAVRAASIGEVAWADGDGVHVRGVVPLAGEGGPVLALPYAEAAAARALGRAADVLLATREHRATSSAFRPLTLRCRPRLVEDPEGERFLDGLLDQELRRYPPSRLLADSVVLRREHWWWLPRLLIELEVTGEEAPLTRVDERDHLLVVSTEDGGAAGRLVAAPVRLERLPRDGEDLPPLEVDGPAPAPGRAVLHGQDASFPDLERWGRWSWRGRWTGSALEVAESPSHVGLPAVPGLLSRLRRQRALKRACLAGLRG